MSLFLVLLGLLKVALDGRLGLEALKARPMEFSLVLLDVIMPGIDGFEVQQLKPLYWRRLYRRCPSNRTG